MMTRMSVLGTGAWGTTFAQVLADAGHAVTMWGRNSEIVSAINSHENPRYVPDLVLSESISATCDLRQAVDGADLLIVAIPVKAVRATLEAPASEMKLRYSHWPRALSWARSSAWMRC